MASPMPMAPMGNWGSQGQQQQHSQQQHHAHTPSQEQPMLSQSQDDGAPQLRLMGLKVSYTVDREAQVNYLARHPQPLNVQVVPLDERNSIGIADLRVCAQCIVDCSPEILGQGSDYTVYAYDFSEPDHPLVGQGMLSWILESDATQSKIVIGRVTKNMLAAFGGGLKETLEVKFKLTPSVRISRPEARPAYHSAESQYGMDQPRGMTPTGVSEWNSFIQSNPQLGQGPGASRMASPAPAPPHGRAEFVHHRSDSFSVSRPNPQSLQQQSQGQRPQMPQSEPAHPHVPQQQSDGPNRVAPVPVEAPTDGANPPSRPSSRASTRSRKKAPTGRPRGRPRKKPLTEPQGSTSGYEDGTDGEEGPAKKKRATTVQVSKNINTPFGGGPESLRVAASTSGSIRTMRPAGQTPDPTQGNHLQDVPRAPTPVPEGGPWQGPGRQGNVSSLRRQSTLSQATGLLDQSQPSYCELSFDMSPPSQDGRSPGDSEVATPLYSDDSPAAIGSSPPVPRATSFIRSSPPASSPILPPMPKPQPDSGFMSGGVEEAVEEPIKPLELPPPDTASLLKKRSRNTPKFPVRVFTMQLEAVSSEADLVPFHHVPAPPRLLTRNSSFHNPPLPLPEAGKEPSPQLEEPAVASKTTVDADSATAPAEHARTAPEQSFEKQLEDELLAQLQAVADVDVELPAIATEGNSPSVVFEVPKAPASQQRSSGQENSFPTLPTIPASDPIGPLALPPLPRPAATSFSEAPCPPSEAPEAPRSPRSNKNYVKKESIRQRLQQAIQSGEMPPYCHNCGAIETPTWRKIWVQDHEGVPENYEYSEKPGRVTAVIVLERDEDKTVTKYQLIKKSLAPKEDKLVWQQLLLCNPCGIWLCKWKSNRPEERWEKDQTRLQNGGRRSRKAGGRVSKPRKKSQKAEPTSELNFETDPAGPEGITDSDFAAFGRLHDIEEVKRESRSREASQALEQALRSDFQPPSREHRFKPGSTHSRGSGTAGSPIALDEEEEAVKMGTTRRLLFPSPRKDGMPKLLTDVSINLIKTPPLPQEPKEGEANKENIDNDHGMQSLGVNDDDDLEALFRSPMVRPSTPPPKDKSANPGPFKTPTRPTPSHRPVTRSISKSIRSARSNRSAEQASAMLQRTPTRTPRSIARLFAAESPTLRRSPRFAHSDGIMDTPMTRSLNQLLSDAHDFDLDPSALNIDLSVMPDMEGAHEMIDFGNLLSTDAIMPSSPPKGGHHGGFDYVGTASMWGEWSDTGHLDVDVDMED